MTTGLEPGNDGTPRDATGPRLRASDAERAATAAVLQDSVARGLLDHEEGGDRMAAALGARFVDELPGLTADLPPAATPVTSQAVGWRRLGSMLGDQVRYEVQAGVAGGLRSRQVAAAVLVALLLLGVLVALGSLAVHGIVDGGYEHHLDLGQ